jgi:hypothetical protein
MISSLIVLAFLLSLIIVPGLILQKMDEQDGAERG